MIENLYKSSLPIVLNDCFLLVDNKPVSLKRSYVFIKTTSLKVAKIGDDWVVDYIRNKTNIEGYFYSNMSSFGLFNEDLIGKEVKLIGNKGNIQYQFSGVSVGKSKSHVGENSFHISKFSALEYEKVHLPKEKTEDKEDVGGIEEGGDI